MKNKSVSLCMIVKNEEKCLERCLKSVQGKVDEIIIVDTGSNDCTKEIARKYTDQVYDFEWINDFSAARNYSLNFATSDYILHMDADEILDDPENELKKISIRIFTISVLRMISDPVNTYLIILLDSLRILQKYDIVVPCMNKFHTIPIIISMVISRW